MAEKKQEPRRKLLSVAARVLIGAAIFVPLTGCIAQSLPEMPRLDDLVSKIPLVQRNAGPPAGPDISKMYPERKKKRFHYGRPLAGFTTANFVGSFKCAVCHEQLTDKNGNNVSISDHWRSTMMANAAKDPLWQAKVRSEVKRNPALKKVIEEKCASCHMPMAWTQANGDKMKYQPEKSDGIFSSFLSPANGLHTAAMDGVSCSLCHQIQDNGLGTSNSFSGKFTINMGTPAPVRPIFGPYKDPFVESMMTSVGYTPIYGPQMNDAALCATCHTLFTPYVDSAGRIAGEFPEQTVYLEWLHSNYGEPVGVRHDMGELKENVRVCQECHMPHSKAGGVIVAKPADKDVKEREHFSMHHFVGGNALMMNILMDFNVPLEVSASTEKLEATRDRTVNLLQENTARLFLDDVRLDKDVLTTVVKIESLVGHKFPSGFPSRRAWIHFAVTDAAGSVIFESGAPKFDGSVIGDDADAGVGVEPHYDLITAADQVQIYEGVMHDTDGRLTYTLLRGAGYLKDNRLLPNGFNKKTAGSSIAVYGAATKDDNFTGGSDRVTYQVNTTGKQGPFAVKAFLFYTPISYSFMQDLREDEDLDEVDRFWTYYDRADKQPVAVAAAEKRVR